MKEKKAALRAAGWKCVLQLLEDFIFCIKNLKENPKKQLPTLSNGSCFFFFFFFFTDYYNISKLSIIFPNYINI